jgi:hypothetical protein
MAEKQWFKIAKAVRSKVETIPAIGRTVDHRHQR